MRLLPDWRAVLTRAWSIRLILLAAVLSGLEVALPLLPWAVHPGVFAALAGAVSATALLARLLVQRDLRGNRGVARGKVLGGAAVAASVALAVPLVARWEGLKLDPYTDIVGVRTVCYGETRGVQERRHTKAECDAMLAAAVAEFGARLDSCLTREADMPPAMRAALYSWAYNVGIGAACRSTLVRLANAGDFRAACEQLPRWNRAGGREVRGLSNRRAEERALCLADL
jgi:GH24 family phage-related lysozyme (muramidase)